MKKTKKLTALLTAACIGGTMILPVCAEPVIGGDINGDGNADVTDVVMLAAHVKSIKALDSEQLFAADINVDGEVDLTDLMVLTAQVKNIRPADTADADLLTCNKMLYQFIKENDLHASTSIGIYDLDDHGTGEFPPRKVVWVQVNGSLYEGPVSDETLQKHGDAAIERILKFMEENGIAREKVAFDVAE